MKIEKAIKTSSEIYAKLKKKDLERKYGKNNVIATYDQLKNEYEIRVINRKNELER